MKLPFSSPRPIPRERQRKCRVRIKKSSDGSITKEISNCTKEEVAALLNDT